MGAVGFVREGGTKDRRGPKSVQNLRTERAPGLRPELTSPHTALLVLCGESDAFRREAGKCTRGQTLRVPGVQLKLVVPRTPAARVQLYPGPVCL